MKSINYDQSFAIIIKEEVKTIMHSRKSLLFNVTSVWIKREGDPDFEVTMVALMARRFVSQLVFIS